MISIRTTLYSLMLAALLYSCSGGNREAHPTANDADLKSSIGAYVEAFNQHDHEKIASFWEQDAILHNPITGETVEGREEIANYFKDKFEKNPNEKLKITADNIAFTDPDNAIVKSHFSVTDDDGVKIAGRIQGEYVKENGKWYIWNFSQFEQLPVSSHYEKLEKMNWLAGKWIDASEDIDVSSEWTWDKHNNFLTELFDMKVLGEEDFEGYQIFGWDPAKEKIHSWMFDSDGGFGEGNWIQKDDSWYGSMVYTLPNGKTGSSTNIYTKIDENAYTFSSVDRDIDGTILPNVGPFKIVRKQ